MQCASRYWSNRVSSMLVCERRLSAAAASGKTLKRGDTRRLTKVCFPSEVAGHPGCRELHHTCVKRFLEALKVSKALCESNEP